MPRPHRTQAAEAIYHVTCRGVNRRSIFLDDLDRWRFAEILERQIARLAWTLHSFCLMTNHYHLLVQVDDPNLADGMTVLNGLHARRFNRRHGREDHLFGKRYDAELVVTDGHFLETIRYIELNPVRAGACPLPHEWRWSSFRATAGLASPPPFLSTGLVLAFFRPPQRGARERYERYVLEGLERSAASVTTAHPALRDPLGRNRVRRPVVTALTRSRR